jgi:hypothetical protein
MSYFSQAIVFVLALMGLLFKSTKTDGTGKTIHTANGLPVLTRTGRVVIVLLTISFVLSLLTMSRKAASDDQQKNDAIGRQRELSTQLNDVRQQNQGLRDGIGEIIKASSSLSEAQKKSFQSVLTEQKQSGEDTANNIRSSAHVLRSGIDSTIDLLNLSTKQIDRSLNPLNAIKLSYWVEVDVDGPEFAAYKARLRRGVSEFIRRYPTFDSYVGNTDQDFRISSGDGNGNIITVSLGTHSKYYPSQIDEGLAYQALSFRPHVCLRKTPLPSPDPCSYWDETGDLRFLTKPKDENSRPEVEVNIYTYALTVTMQSLIQNVEFTRSNGILLAVPDLPSSQIVMYLENELPMKPIPGHPGSFHAYAPGLSKRRISIGHVNLVMDVQGRELWIREPLLKKVVKGDKVYLYATFPTSDRMAGLR